MFVPMHAQGHLDCSGFKVEGIWRKHTWADGEWVDIVNM
jgi:hypothetical protein